MPPPHPFHCWLYTVGLLSMHIYQLLVKKGDLSASLLPVSLLVKNRGLSASLLPVSLLDEERGLL